MRSMWKGVVSFGLVSIPVKMYSATQEKDVSFNQVRRSDGSRIRYKRVAEADGEEVSYGDIAKGYQLDTGETVILTDEDFAELPLATAHVLDVMQFVPMEQVDPIHFSKSYYLEPERTGLKPYVLLREALDDSGMVALVKVAIRTREQLATLRVRANVIVLATMLWPDEIRTPEFAFLDEDIALREPEKKMAAALVQSMAGDFDPQEYSDDYRSALMQVIEAKTVGREVVETPDAAPTASNVVDLMAALRASVDAAKRKRGESVTSAGDDGVPQDDAAEGGASPAPASAGSAPAEKAPAKRGPAKKVTATKATAVKAPAKATAAKAPAKSTAAKAAAAKAPGKRASAATGLAKTAAAKKASAKKASADTASAKTASVKTASVKTASVKTASVKTASAKQDAADTTDSAKAS